MEWMINKDSNAGGEKKFQSWMDFVSDYLYFRESINLALLYTFVHRTLRLTISSASEGCHSRLERQK